MKLLPSRCSLSSPLSLSHDHPPVKHTCPWTSIAIHGLVLLLVLRCCLVGPSGDTQDVLAIVESYNSIISGRPHPLWYDSIQHESCGKDSTSPFPPYILLVFLSCPPPPSSPPSIVLITSSPAFPPPAFPEALSIPQYMQIIDGSELGPLFPTVFCNGENSDFLVGKPFCFGYVSWK